MTTTLESGRFLGKKEASYDRRDSLWADHRASLKVANRLPSIPQIFGHGLDFSDWLMLGNGPDQTVSGGFQGCGDCFWAGAGHEHMEFAHNTQRPVPRFTGDVIVKEYEAYSGYNRTTGADDDGTDLHEGVSWRQHKGIHDADDGVHKIGSYVFGEPKNLQHLLEMAYLFEGAGVGIEFPESADDQFSLGKPWSVVSGAPVVGGHYIWVPGRPQPGLLALITWAKRIVMTEGFYNKYNDEIFAYVTPEQFKAVTGKDYEGFNEEHLETFLHMTAQQRMAA